MNLSTSDQFNLIKQAKQASLNSYSPYSNFKVGAALLTKNGQIIQGCNVENKSLNTVICAERSACVKAVSDGFLEFVAIAVACQNKLGQYQVDCWPCGICRQFLLEFNPNMLVLVEKSVDSITMVELSQIFPID